MNVLLIAKHWPEPNSTAAGRRTFDLLNVIDDFEIHCASASAFNEHTKLLQSKNIQCHQIHLNDNRFDAFIKELNPDIVIYDRFMIEEQYSWRVRTQCPNCMTILDTSDLHCLRQARKIALNKKTSLNLNNDSALREIASIQRCDLTIMISQIEIDILKNHFHIPMQKLVYFPFVVEQNEIQQPYPNFESRQHMMMIGNFLHEPNWDANRFMVNEIWPLVHKQLPNVELHIYGAYSSDKHQQLNQPKKNVMLKGRCEDALKTMSKYRINLAPLRFGAGQKGKVLEGWITKTATLGSPIAFESMIEGCELGFTPTTNPQEFADLIVHSYQDAQHNSLLIENAKHILLKNFLKENHCPALLNRINEHFQHLMQHRNDDFYQSLLWQNQFKSTEYMSKWIESKNQLNN